MDTFGGVWQWVAFLVFAPVSVLAGVQVFRVMSMVQAALYLFASFVAAAGLFFVVGAEFLGAVQILMMVGEMAIMALFMIMYMHMPGGQMQMDMSHQKTVAKAVTVLFYRRARGSHIHPGLGRGSGVAGRPDRKPRPGTIGTVHDHLRDRWRYDPRGNDRGHHAGKERRPLFRSKYSY